MDRILTITKTTGDSKLSYKLLNDVIYFKGKDVAEILGYSNTDKAFMVHVDDEYKRKLKDISTTPEMGKVAGSDCCIIYITEPGLYQLIFVHLIFQWQKSLQNWSLVMFYLRYGQQGHMHFQKR